MLLFGWILVGILDHFENKEREEINEHLSTLLIS